MNYNLNEVSNLFFLQETNMFGISVLSQKKNSFTEENAVLFVSMKRQTMPSCIEDEFHWHWQCFILSAHLLHNFN